MNQLRIKILVVLIYLIPAFVSAQNEEKPKYAPGKEKHRNKSDELGRKQGTWVIYNSFGEKLSETDWVNDSKEGMEKKYWQAGKIKEETEYLAGIKEGTYNKYYFSGQVSQEGQYLNGKKDGKWTRYFEDGTIRQEGTYKSGKKDGVWKTYNRKGAVTNQGTYKEGMDTQAIELAKKKADEKKAAADKKAQEKTPVKGGQAGKSAGVKATPMPADTTKKK